MDDVIHGLAAEYFASWHHIGKRAEDSSHFMKSVQVSSHYLPNGKSRLLKQMFIWTEICQVFSCSTAALHMSGSHNGLIQVSMFLICIIWSFWFFLVLHLVFTTIWIVVIIVKYK